MDYGQLLKDAWQLVWNHKFLLVLGFLAALGSGTANSNNFTYDFSGDEFSPQFFDQLDLFWAAFAPILMGLICFGIFLAIILWLVRLTAQAGLISAADRISSGEKVSLGQALGAGIGKLGRMIGIQLILYGPFILLALVLAALSVLMVGAAVGYEVSNASDALEPILASIGIVIACVALLFCVLAPLLLVVAIILPFAQRAAVLEDMGVTASLGRAWWMIRNNLGEVAILVLLVVALGIGFGIAVAIIMLPLAGLLFAPMVIGLINDGTLGTGNVAALVCGGLALAILGAFLNALWTTYRSTTMTLAYRLLLEKSP